MDIGVQNGGARLIRAGGPDQRQGTGYDADAAAHSEAGLPKRSLDIVDEETVVIAGEDVRAHLAHLLYPSLKREAAPLARWFGAAIGDVA